MSNYVEIEFTDTYDDLARKINMIDPVAKLERDTVDPEIHPRSEVIPTSERAGRNGY